MKKILLILFIFITVVITVLSINKTFFKDDYKIENGNIPIPKYSYYYNTSITSVTDEYSFNYALPSTTIRFKTIRSLDSIRKIIAPYIENLKSCYDEGYFYDAALDITISRYDIDKSNFLNEITLTYSAGDYCKNEYILKDNWINLFNQSTISEAKLVKCNETCAEEDINFNLADYINSNSTRIINDKNIISPTGNYITIYFTYEKSIYNLLVYNYNDYLAFKLIDANDHSMNAIYDVDISI